MRNQNLTSIKSSEDKNEDQKTFSGWRSALVSKWATAWKFPSFKWKFWSGMMVLAGILIAFPFFFNAIEDRNGKVMSDFVLEMIPARNVSLAVFFLIWSCCLILVIRMYRDPMMLLVTLWAYNVVTLVRMAFISLISLNPPAGLIPLADPITNQFYGGRYITHDLFFSGHTTTVFLIFLCLKKKPDRIYALLASVTLGFLLLLQHVHYTIDVLAAPVFTYAVYRLAVLFTKPEYESLIKATNLKN
ncbi:MAG: sphingomyelin synthase family protein [Bacteroidota bacterium]|nr:sphingomyelin synthase family protein [Bacteroidota bacterium]